MIKYLGSKRLLLPVLGEVFAALRPASSVLDLFSGTARVGHLLKGAGWRVLSNDHNAYAHVLAQTYVQADREDVIAEVARCLPILQTLPPSPGWFTERYAEQSRYLQAENAGRIEAIRQALDAWSLGEDVRAVLMTSLLEAADRVDSTTGVQMAYLKQWSARSHRPLTLRIPDVLPAVDAGRCAAFGLEAHEAAATIEADVAYLDPPYNHHRYNGNYHVWETLVRYDNPDVYGIACKRVDCRTKTSAFNLRSKAAEALQTLIASLRAPHVVLSFSDEGFFTTAQIEAMLAQRGAVAVLERAHPRYVGARIGIYSPAGERVGTPGHLHNRERIYLATRDLAAMTRFLALDGARRVGPD